MDSLFIPSDCAQDIQKLQANVTRRAKQIPRPSGGCLTKISPVYGCDDLAAHSISDALKAATGPLSSNTGDYTWNILIFFHGRATIGNTATLMIPIVTHDTCTLHVVQDGGTTAALETSSRYHVFHKLHTLEIEGDGWMAALCITALGERLG
ncbi:hypothetical protein BJY01DRAFT_229516 [Aspergillus pseudoustus]|uniref:Uncharacterized protein n=1 Tax=Aspergillus pseudoustus TaxID=1810923 RepID=A0ABR4IGL7_9EURO